MATSGTVTTNSYDGRYLEVYWYRKDYSIANNTSTIAWTLSAKGGNSGYYYTGNVTLNMYGEVRYSHADRWKCWKGEIASGEFTVNHNTDGTAAFGISIAAGIYYYAVNCTGSNGYIPLPTIPRASSPTTDTSWEYFGNSIRINTNRASSNFTHTIKYTMGNKSGTIATGVGDYYDWTIPNSLMNEIPSTDQATVTITCYTYNGNTHLGTKTTSFVAWVHENHIPSISDIVLTEMNSAVTGGFVQNESWLRVTVKSSGTYGSSITGITTTVNGETHNGSTFTTDWLRYTGSCSVKTTVTDSRGRKAEKVEWYTVANGITDLGIELPTRPERGKIIKMTLPRKSSNFRHKIKYEFGGIEGIIADNIENEYNWTIPEELDSLFGRNSVKEDIRIIVETHSARLGFIGDTWARFNLYLIESVAPTIAGIEITEKNQKVSEAFPGLFVQNESIIHIQFDYTIPPGTTEDYVGIHVANRNTNESQFDYTAYEYGQQQITMFAADERARKEYKYESINVIQYFKPRILNVELVKCTKDGVITNEGNCLKVSITAEFSPVKNLNTAQLKLRYASASEGIYKEGPTLDVTNYKFEDSVIIEGITPDEAYNVEVTAIDKLNTTLEKEETGEVVISRLAGGKGITFFGEAEKEGIWDGLSGTRFPFEIFSVDTDDPNIEYDVNWAMVPITLKQGTYLVQFEYNNFKGGPTDGKNYANVSIENEARTFNSAHYELEETFWNAHKTVTMVLTEVPDGKFKIFMQTNGPEAVYSFKANFIKIG